MTNGYEVDFSQYSQNEISAIITAVRVCESEKIDTRLPETVNIDSIRNRERGVNMSSGQINSIILGLDHWLNNGFHEKYSDIPSSGLSGDMAWHFRNRSREGARKALRKLKELQER